MESRYPIIAQAGEPRSESQSDLTLDIGQLLFSKAAVQASKGSGCKHSARGINCMERLQHDILANYEALQNIDML